MLDLKRLVLAACCYFLMTLCAVSAQADTTYTYTGMPFNIVQCIPPVTDCLDASIDGSFTLALPLGDNLHGAVVNPESYSFGTESLIATNLNIAPGNPPQFQFSTNASGQIDGWNVLVTGSEYDGVIIESFSNPSGILCSCYPFGSEDDVAVVDFPILVLITYTPGTWSVSTTGIDVPESATGTLLIAGLVGLAGLALKKSGHLFRGNSPHTF
jgi:hypothetical protein